MNRKPSLSSLLVPRDRKTAAELIDESASLTTWLTLLMFAMGLLITGLVVAALRDTPPSQSSPITTTVEDYRG